MDYLSSFYQNWQTLIWLVFSTGMVALFYYTYRKEIGLWWLGVRHRNIMFGKIRSLAKNPTINGAWFHVEQQICQDYKPYYSNIRKDKNYYIACREYLDLVGESGRQPLTPILVFGLFIVLVLEAWGFSYTMAGFIDLSASENTRKIMAMLVAITFALALAFVTHNMGAELYRNKLIDNIRELWAADRDPEPSLTQQAGINIGSIQNSSDVNAKPYIRRLNRLKLGKSTKSFKATITAIIAIVVIAAILTFVRVKSLESNQTDDALCNVTNVSQAGTSSEMPNFDNLYGGDNDMPNVAKQQNSEAVAAGVNQKCEATKEGSWATFGMLAILFLLLQGFSTWVSMARGFAGAQSSEAYKRTHKHQTPEEFETHYENKSAEIADLAQKSLSRLQTQMANVLPKVTPSSEVNELIKTANKRTFYKFIQDQEAPPTPAPMRVPSPISTATKDVDLSITDEELFSGKYTDDEVVVILRAKKAAAEKEKEQAERKARLISQAEETPEERMARLSKLAEETE